MADTHPRPSSDPVQTTDDHVDVARLWLLDRRGSRHGRVDRPQRRHRRHRPLRKSMTAAVVGCIVAAGPLVINAAPAQAQDRRPCVSRHEFNLIYNMPIAWAGQLTRAKLEHRWEVGGTGFRITDPNVVTQNEIAWAYPACAFAMDQVQVIAVYNAHTLKLDAVGRIKDGGPRHGHV
jgi:zona occludens toxin (predicted ATPase)